MDRERCKAIRGLLQQILPLYADEFKQIGVSVRDGNAKFDTIIGTATFKLEFVDLADNGEKVDIFAENFKRQAQYYGLNPEILGKKFTDKMRGNEFTVVGLNPAKRKKCILISDGNKTYITTPETIIRMFPNEHGKPTLFDTGLKIVNKP